MVMRWGRGGAPPRPGWFIKNLLEEVGEDYPGHMHILFKEANRGLRTLKGNPYRLCTYKSFIDYCQKLETLGLIERSDRVEPVLEGSKARLLVLPHQAIYYRLTDKGRRLTKDDPEWADPSGTVIEQKARRSVLGRLAGLPKRRK